MELEMYCPIKKDYCDDTCTFRNKEFGYCHLVRAISEIPKQLEEIEKQLRKLNKK